MAERFQQPADPRRVGPTLQSDPVSSSVTKMTTQRFFRVLHLTLFNDLTPLQNAVVARTVAKIQTYRHQRLLFHRTLHFANLLHGWSPSSTSSALRLA